MTNRDELNALLKQAAEHYKKMTPEQKKAQYYQQRRSWVIGEMMIMHPNMTREEAEGIYNQVSL